VRACIGAEPVVEGLVERRKGVGLVRVRVGHDGKEYYHTCCERPDGYLLDDGVSGTELRDGESSGLRSV
jgi:hypothetical protein